MEKNISSEISPSTQYLTGPETRSKLKENRLDPSGDKLVIKKKKRWDQYNICDLKDNSVLLKDNDVKFLLNEKLSPGFALKSNQKLGKRGGKRLDVRVIEKLKEMFLASNMEKSNKFSTKDMLKNLKADVENNELEIDNIPTLHQIKSWITRFNQYHKKKQLKR
jgi:hypothetical protein